MKKFIDLLKKIIILALENDSNDAVRSTLIDSFLSAIRITNLSRSLIHIIEFVTSNFWLSVDR